MPMNNDELLEKIGKLIEPLKQDLQEVKRDVKSVKTDLNKQADDMAGFFHKTWEKIGMLDERVTRLEETADITHRN